MTSAMSSSTADRYAQTRVPMSRNSVSRWTWSRLVVPVLAASRAMNVIASVLTTPYTNQTTSHSQ
jgi:hypothetical protein